MTTVGGVKTQSTQDTYSQVCTHRCRNITTVVVLPRGARSLSSASGFPAYRTCASKSGPQNVALKTEVGLKFREKKKVIGNRASALKHACKISHTLTPVQRQLYYK